MVFRLFVPPGEGQHNLVLKRPDPLGANATLQYSILGSTAVAAAYTSFATRYSHRVTPGCTFSRPALFIRSSAKLGLWAGVLGAAANWYYNSRFMSVVLSQRNPEVRPWKLYERTKSPTIDDGCFVGAGLGLAASVPAFFMRRLAIPRWTRCLGLANIGACAGILGAHGYLQYTGDRKKAYARLDCRLQRRSLAFWELFWDKKIMAKFNPLVQLYIRHNALWYAQQLPDSAFEQAEDYDAVSAGSQEANPHANSSYSTHAHEDQSYYLPPFDCAEDLKYISVEATHAKIEEHEAEIAALLKEAEFVLFVSAHRQYEYCHLEDVGDEERRQRLEELQLLQLIYNNIRSAAEQLQSRLINWRMSLQHKAIMDSPGSANSSVAAWLPQSTHDFKTHDPVLSIQELERTQAALDAEIKSFEASIAYPGYTKEKKDRWRMDLEDGRSLLRVADKIVWDFEKMQDAARNKSMLDPSEPASHTKAHPSVAERAGAQVDSTAVTKRDDGSLEVGKS
ncbi:hypothetical protein BU25DRAFT_405540 [Macroventuria anomochaeta]|uniref:Uncharacterized protein n=1 Tax=Macroventuria anomochaeta TaxID=301207 RepID=A0ACB6SJ22_9PLEO|nr:uncharacterized protein BU25DRAFT_405540 [Macroventuria anomochaeta]KAF2633670.1 hypothetical protein BU25DRAFT_405540 [Macroventuria anomochaeta]